MPCSAIDSEKAGFSGIAENDCATCSARTVPGRELVMARFRCLEGNGRWLCDCRLQSLSPLRLRLTSLVRPVRLGRLVAWWAEAVL